MLTPEQFDEVRKVLEKYNYRHQPAERGPGCRACAHAGDGHAAKSEPVCQTVMELLYDLEFLIEDPAKKLVSPNRQVELKLEIGADDQRSLLHLLEKFQEQIAAGSKSCVSGGFMSGGSYSVEIHAEQTHDKWESELNVYLAKLEKKEAGQKK